MPGKRSHSQLGKDKKHEKKKDAKDMSTDEAVLRDVSKMTLGVKGGSSAYGRVFPRRAPEMKKTTSGSTYDKQSGLVTKNSREFQEIAKLLQTKNCTLIENIGSGNYAEVYKAYHNRKSRDVAVKVIDLVKCRENYKLKFLPREIDIMIRLRHKNIVKLFEIIQSTRRIIIIMEYCVNGTVADLIKQFGAISEDVALAMFRQMLEALHYMHSLKIAHRDLKVENILLNNVYSPKLSDFSLSKVSDANAGLSSTFCGSIPYFPPEILSHQRYEPMPADIWSLGICLYVMLNDGLPFPIDDERLMLENQIKRKWDLKSRMKDQISKAAKECLTKMLEPNTSKRPTTTTLLLDKWLHEKITIV